MILVRVAPLMGSRGRTLDEVCGEVPEALKFYPIFAIDYQLKTNIAFH